MKRNTSGTSIDHRSGSEGPRHDPYSWDEWIVSRRGHVYCIRLGSIGYVRLNIDGITTKSSDVSLPWPHRDRWECGMGYTDEELFLIGCFERRVGMDLDMLCHVYHERIYVEDPMGCLADYE